MSYRITLHTEGGQRTSVRTFPGVSEAVQFTCSELSYPYTPWHKFSVEHIEAGFPPLTIVPPTTFAEQEARSKALFARVSDHVLDKLSDASTFAEAIEAVGGHAAAKSTVIANGDDAEAVIASVFGPVVATQARADAEKLLGIAREPELTQDDVQRIIGFGALKPIWGPASAAIAERVVADLEAIKRKVGDAAWSLDSGLSDHRKVAAGYRNPDAATGRSKEHDGITDADLFRRLYKAQAVLTQITGGSNSRV